ncbi:MAG TPA: mechanosensitive ion channel family protein [Rhodanobacteraceae bacterium]|jgi:miniconductance mechanosensitive channel|nr:mechanosensitive ion channel family protein [Rhodanobacteraceae bacterium]
MQSLETLLQQDWIHTLLGCVLLVLVAWLAGRLVRYAMIHVMRIASRKTAWRWDDAMVKHGVFLRLAQVVPLLILNFGLRAVPGVPEIAEQVVAAITMALIVVFVVLAINATLSAMEDLYHASPRGRERSIKGYVQLVKIVLFVIGVILIIAALFQRDPLTLLAGLGAVSAVLLLIFKDTIMSVVASVQIGSYDMLRVGDWIALPEDNVDGDVVEISLNTVKVVNWDKTLSTIPTWHLISKSYRNYRNMYETGRRIRRALNIDITSVHFHTPEEIEHLQQFKLLDEYFRQKEKELAAANASLEKQGVSAINERRLTNLGSFRAYMQAYIGSHPGINQDLFWAVRQLDPEPTGIPIQVYAYTRNTSFVPHENVQGDIFDHLITILPEFGLSLFQQPSGTDLRAGLSSRTAASRLERDGSADELARVAEDSHPR